MPTLTSEARSKAQKNWVSICDARWLINFRNTVNDRVLLAVHLLRHAILEEGEGRPRKSDKNKQGGTVHIERLNE